MNLINIFELAAAAFGLFSGVFFCVGVLHVKDATLEKIAVSMWGKGQTIAVELAQQKSEFIVGAMFLFTSFFLQIGTKLIPSEWANMSVAGSISDGVLIGIGVPTVVLLITYLPFRQYQRSSVKRLLANVTDKC